MTWTAERCCCPEVGFDPACPWARAPFNGIGDPLGHCKACPVSGEPCPCMDGSTAQAYCYIQAREEAEDASAR